MESLFQEIRYSVRSLATRPLVAVVAVLSLSLGIGINTAIFSILSVSWLPASAGRLWLS